MRAQILLTIDFDVDYLESRALNTGRPIEAIMRELVGDCECRGFDSIRWVDGIARVGSGAHLSIPRRAYVVS